MKQALIILILSLFLCGCSLIPKPVELFQKKVGQFPMPTAAYTETQKQAAQLAKEKAQETLTAVLTEKSSPAVVVPATDTAHLTEAVSVSLGPPSKSVTNSDETILKLQSEVARLNKKINAFQHSNQEVVGKKIEGTGLVSVPYFIWAGGFVLVIFVGWHLAKTALTLASAVNPGAGIAVGGMNVAGSVVAKGFQQVIQGGEDFKAWIEKEVSDSGLQQKLLSAFTTSHKVNQDQDVQAIIKSVTAPTAALGAASSKPPVVIAS